MVEFAIVALIVVVPLWRIFQRAGLAPAFSLLAIIPLLGLPIVAILLARSDWPNAGEPTTQPGAP